MSGYVVNHGGSNAFMDGKEVILIGGHTPFAMTVTETTAMDITNQGMTTVIISNPMKAIIFSLALLSFISPALAIDQTQLDERVRLLTAKFEAMQQKPDKRVPADVLKKAQGIILLDRTKAGFIFAYQGGNGVAMVKDTSGNWSPAAFLSATEASLGFQIGGEQNFYVILLMTTNATQALTESTIDFGGEARGTAGDQSSGVEGKVTTPEHSALVYDDRNGLYGGAAIKGGAISPDDNANLIYYGQPLTMQNILFDKKVKATQSASDLAEKISDWVKVKP